MISFSGMFASLPGIPPQMQPWDIILNQGEARRNGQARLQHEKILKTAAGPVSRQQCGKNLSYDTTDTDPGCQAIRE